MHHLSRIYQSFAKILTGFIYLSFFLVQFNIHLNGTPGDISYFSSGYSSVQYNPNSYSTSSHIDSRKESKLVKFKLNKRFHPSSFFTTPELTKILIDLTYQTDIPQIRDEKLLPQYFYHSPSLRGPPSMA